MNKPITLLAGADLGKRIVIRYKGTEITGHLLHYELTRTRFSNFHGSEHWMDSATDPMPGIVSAKLTVGDWSATIPDPEMLAWHYAYEHEAVTQDIEQDTHVRPLPTQRSAQ